MLLTLILASVLSNAGALTIYVPDHYSTIQEAIAAAEDADTVIVRPGYYAENIDYLGKSIVVMSEQGPLITTIDGNQAGSVVTFVNGEGPNAVLQGFTITNGSGTYDPERGHYYGGGIYCGDNASPMITNNIIRQNSVDRAGGGIYCIRSSPTIGSNTITMNTSGDKAGGILCDNASPLIINNIITENSAGYAGGAIACRFHAAPTIAGNTFVGNEAGSFGGAIYCFHNSSASLLNSILWGDSAGAGQEIFVTAESSIMVRYCCVAFGWYGVGNIDADPLFVEVDDTTDYNLLPDSPCIDSGDPDTEVPHYGGDRIDMGAFEYQYPEDPPLRLIFGNTPAIGERGETLVWDFMVENLMDHPVTFDGWLAVSGPRNSLRDSIPGVVIPPGEVFSGNVYLHIPNGTPPGIYTAKGRVGIMHQEIWDGEVFGGEIVTRTVTGTYSRSTFLPRF